MRALESELKGLLRKHGATQIVTGQDDAIGIAVVQFIVTGRQVRFELPYPRPEHYERQAETEPPHGWKSWSRQKRREWAVRQAEQSERQRWPPLEQLPRGCIVGGAKLVEVVTAERATSPWHRPGAYGWRLESVRPAPHFVECKGEQGWWSVPGEVLERLRATAAPQEAPRLKAHTGPSCRSCGAPILWAVTETGRRRIPVDAAPVDNGNLRIERREGRTVAVVVPPAPGLHQSHFASCPHAGAHRRARA